MKLPLRFHPKFGTIIREDPINTCISKTNVLGRIKSNICKSPQRAAFEMAVETEVSRNRLVIYNPPSVVYAVCFAPKNC